MHRSFNRHLVSCVLTLFLIFLFSAPVSAHRMIVKPVEEGVVTVIYEGGRKARRAEVVVYSEKGEEIARGSMDENGHFHYPVDQGDVRIVAEDGIGHKAEWRSGDSYEEELPRGLTVTLVFLGFVIIALIFHYRIKKKEESMPVD